MGVVGVDVLLCGRKGCKYVVARVDTGADAVLIPRDIWDEIEPEPTGIKRRFDVVKGGGVIYDVYRVKIEYVDKDGVRRVAEAEAIKSDTMIPSLSVEAMEKLRLAVDPVKREVVEKPYIFKA